MQVPQIVFALDQQERKQQMQEAMDRIFTQQCQELGLEPTEQNRKLFDAGAAAGGILTRQLTEFHNRAF